MPPAQPKSRQKGVRTSSVGMSQLLQLHVACSFILHVHTANNSSDKRVTVCSYIRLDGFLAVLGFRKCRLIRPYRFVTLVISWCWNTMRNSWDSVGFLSSNMQHFRYNETITWATQCTEKVAESNRDKRHVNLKNISEAWGNQATYSAACLPTPRLKCLFNSKETILCGWWRWLIWLTHRGLVRFFQSQCACKFNQPTVAWILKKKHFIICFERLSKAIIAGVANRQGGLRLQVLRMCCFLKPDSCMPLIPGLAAECTFAYSQISSSSSDCKCWPCFAIFQAVILCKPLSQSFPSTSS